MAKRKKPPAKSRKSTRLNRKGQEAYERYVKKSTCTIKGFEDEIGLRALQISFGGPGALFPSTSNNRQVSYNKKTKKPFIMKNPAHQGRLKAATDLYTAACEGKKYYFGTTPVCIDIVLCESNRLMDSHNYSKPIADWLEEVGILDDDSRAEIHCTKKKDYDYPSPAQTEILIQRFDLVKEVNRVAVRDRFLTAKRLL